MKEKKTEKEESYTAYDPIIANSFAMSTGGQITSAGYTFTTGTGTSGTYISPGHVPNGTSLADLMEYLTRIEEKLDTLINAEAERIREQYSGNN